MAYVIEIFGKGLVGSLWSIFGQELRDYQSDISSINVQLRERPTDTELMLRMAVSLYRSGQLSEALRFVEELLEICPEDRRVIAIAACVYERIGQKENALDLMETYVQENDIEDASFYFAIGIYYEMLGNTSRAEIYYKKSLLVTPNLCNAHHRLAAMKFKNGDINGAVEHYRELCKIDPEDIDSRLLLAGMLLNAGRMKDASEEYKIALTIEADNWAKEDKEVEECVRKGYYQEAIDLLVESLEKEGDFPEIHLQLAELYARTGNLSDAEYHYQKAIEIHPGYLEAIIRFGTYMVERARFLEAAELFSRAIDVNDRLLIGYIGLAICQHYMRFDDKATEMIEMAEAIEPNSSILFAEVAKLELKASAVKEAREYLEPSADSRSISDSLIELQSQRFRTALKKHPERADWHYRLGLLLKVQNKLREAVSEFKKAIEINPDYVKARMKLALVLYQLGEKKEALEHLKKVVLLEPGYSDVYYQMGLIYADQSQFALAVECFQESLKRNGKNINALYALAQGLINLGLNRRAADALQAIIEIAPQSEKALLAKKKLAELSSQK